MKIISQAWKAQIEEKIRAGVPIDVTTGINICIQWLIEQLVFYKIPYRVDNCGAGVKRVTTGNLDCCPLCKQMLKKGGAK